MLNLKPISIHTHTDLSDGKFSPEILKEYSGNFVDYMILTDHDLLTESNDIWAAEVSARVDFIHKKSTFHFLVYIPVEKINENDSKEEQIAKLKANNEKLSKIKYIQYLITSLSLTNPNNVTRIWLKNIQDISKGRFKFSNEKIARIIENFGPMLTYLDQLDPEHISYDDINLKNRAKAIEILKSEYHISDEEINKLNINPNINCGTLLDAEMLINLVKDAGGYLIVAHPIKTIDKYASYEKELSVYEELTYLEDLIDNGSLKGIDGLEAGHATINKIRTHNEILLSGDHKKNIYEKLQEFALRKNLYLTAGSDFHGSQKSEGIKEIGQIKGKDILYFDFLKVLNPELESERRKYLIENGLMQPNEKICVLKMAHENINNSDNNKKDDLEENEL